VSSYAVDVEANPTVDAVAGAGGALLALLTTYPLMTLNTRQHTHQQLRKNAKGSGGSSGGGNHDDEDDADSDDDDGGGGGEGDSDSESISSNATPIHGTSDRYNNKVSTKTTKKAPQSSASSGAPTRARKSSKSKSHKTIAGDLADLMREGGGVRALYRGIEVGLYKLNSVDP
jgi:hypothetical protein